MSDEAQVLAYSGFDKTPLVAIFKTLLGRTFGDIGAACVADLGCGSGDYCAGLCEALPDATFRGYDASAGMLAIARTRADPARVTFERRTIPDPELPANTFDGVVSTMLLHQLPDPSVLWDTVKQLGRADAFVAVLDMLRVEDRDAREAIVAAYAARAAKRLRVDFRSSLQAAFTVEELEAQLRDAGLPLTVQRHRLPLGFELAFISGRLGSRPGRRADSNRGG